jgi:hypothetical protein
VNYEKLYVCNVRREIERLAEERDKFNTVGGALAWLGSNTLSLAAESDAFSLTA